MVIGLSQLVALCDLLAVFFMGSTKKFRIGLASLIEGANNW